MNYEIIEGDCLQTMHQLPAGSVQCVVTSPPYYGLRDYGTATWEGGDPECDHKQVKETRKAASGSSRLGFPADGGPRRISDDNTYFVGAKKQQYRDLCGKCGARRIDNQIGLEETPEQYVAKLVDVFREVRRLLRDDGVVWLNLGDSYNGSGGAGGDYGAGGLKEGQPKYPGRNVDGLKPKDLIGIPWMCAFALRADGWYLRSEVIWHKKAPMPESVTDRPTKAHEQVFLLSKSAKYYYDADAVRESNAQCSIERFESGAPLNRTARPQDYGVQKFTGNMAGAGKYSLNPAGRNRRSVWTLGPEPYHAAHFATMPTKLVEPCILAGTSAHGCCAACGAPWERVVEREGGIKGHTHKLQDLTKTGKSTNGIGKSTLGIGGGGNGQAWAEHGSKRTTTGWQPTCLCGTTDVVPCTVLDPFNGAATVGLVALKHGRRYIGLELNPDYIALSHDRLGKVQPLLLEVI